MENKTRNLFCLLTGVIVFAFFAHTLNYSWKHFDENIIFQETMMPIPTSISEIFEFVNLYGINNYFIASNPFYSNIYHIRGTPLDVIFNFFVFWLFQKSAFAYHSFSLTLHILNSCLCFLILNNISLSLKSNLFIRLLLVSILTLIWAFHPVNVESVLFATNYGALITYFFCFLLIFLFINNSTSKTTLFNSVILFFLYLFPLFLNEYSVTLPLILFCYLFATYSFYSKMPFKDSFFMAIKRILPLLLALIVFVVYFLLLPTIRTTQESSLIVTLERIFWLSPQIFLHYLKLIFFPIHLSIDQTAFVKFPYSLFHPYAIFSSLFMYSLLLLSFISLFFLSRKKAFFFFILFVPFFLALLPFLHIISPIYCIASERYLYFPLSLLIFGFAFLFFYLLSKLLDSHRDAANRVSTYILTLTIMVILLISFSTRTYFRSLDWKNSTSLLSSAIKISSNNLYKGIREQMLANSIQIFEEGSKKKIYKHSKLANKYLKEALAYFKKEKIKYQDKAPQVIKFYGLDPKTLTAKTAFALAFSEDKLQKEPSFTVKIFLPYIDDLKTIDSTILDFYYRMLFLTKNLDIAEKILLTNLNQNVISSTLYVVLSDLYEYKYNDLQSTEKYLNLSFKFFPYDIFTLFGLKRLYQKLNKADKFAFYSYLYGMRAYDISSLQEASLIYIALNKKDIAKKIIMKLLKDYRTNEVTLEIKRKYEGIYGTI